MTALDNAVEAKDAEDSAVACCDEEARQCVSSSLDKVAHWEDMTVFHEASRGLDDVGRHREGSNNQREADSSYTAGTSSAVTSELVHT